MGKRHGLGAKMFSNILHENGLYDSSAVPASPPPYTHGAIESKQGGLLENFGIQMRCALLSPVRWCKEFSYEKSTCTCTLLNKTKIPKVHQNMVLPFLHSGSCLWQWSLSPSHPRLLPSTNPCLSLKLQHMYHVFCDMVINRGPLPSPLPL